MKNILQKIKQEVLHVLPPTIFFLFAFNIIVITTMLLAKERGIEFPPIVMATFLALVVAKVILLVDHLPFINKFPNKPLAYNIAWKTFIYMVAVIIARYLEHFIPFLREHGSVVEAHRRILEGFEWRRFVAIQLWLLVLFLFYAVMFELVRALGKDRVVKMFFG
jgi:hypothetical protein